MNCEEFELRGLDLDRADANPEEAAEAADHLKFCGPCSALLESWQEVRGELRLLRDATQMNSSPLRVEMRLRQELRTRREAPKSLVAIAAWALAAAAAVAISFGWMWTHDSTKKIVSTVSRPMPSAIPLPNAPSAVDSRMLLAADYDSGEFTELPGSMPSRSNDRTVLQVRMQRGALARFGLPVEPDRAAEWVDVDFLVGEDGQPQGVRLHEDTQIVAATQ
jgi:hypothetical protein